MLAGTPLFAPLDGVVRLKTLPVDSIADRSSSFVTTSPATSRASTHTDT
jgi:hypothetical protein